VGKIVGGEDDVLDDGALFFMAPEPTIFLRDRYMEPPFTVLDRRTGSWQARDRQWKALGIQSEVGRDVRLLTTGGLQGNGATFTSETSIFSPALAELMYRWYSKPGAVVLDPFAGGSVRGIVASHLGRPYIGLELSGKQVSANLAQRDIATDPYPTWVHADSRVTLADWAAGEHAGTLDMIMSCPPYAYLEKYSDDPADISNMPYPKFLEAYGDIIRDACAMLAPNRFAVWVIGEVRDKSGDGSCLGLIADTVRLFQEAGLRLYNDHVMLTPIGTAPQRAPKQFDAARKAGRVHEYALVFIKGDARQASRWLGAVQDKAVDEGTA
jgi:DNA methylase